MCATKTNQTRGGRKAEDASDKRGGEESARAREDAWCWEPEPSCCEEAAVFKRNLGRGCKTKAQLQPGTRPQVAHLLLALSTLKN